MMPKSNYVIFRRMPKTAFFPSELNAKAAFFPYRFKRYGYRQNSHYPIKINMEE